MTEPRRPRHPMARRSRAKRLLGWLVPVVVVGGTASDARADPQWNAGLDIGVAGRGAGEVWGETAFWLGARGDLILGRDGNADVGAGPYIDVGTLAFDELDLGAGASLLLPIAESLPLVLSFGPYLRAGEDDPVLYPVAADAPTLTPGLAASVFWGSRSYDHHGAYEMAGGLLVQVRHGLGDANDTAILLGVHLDALVLALPFLFLGEAISGSSAEAEEIEPIEPPP